MINKNSELAIEFWKTGKLPCPIRDFHAHMHGHSEIYFPFSSADEMAADMKKNGVKSLFFCSHLALYEPVNGESFNREAVKKYPDMLRAYHIIHSRSLDPEREIAEVDENPDIYVGFKILGDYNAFPIDDPVHYPYYEYLNRTGKLLLVHTWGGSGYNGHENVRNIAKRFPDIKIVCGHSFFDLQKEGIEATKEFPNVYYELTAVPIVRGYLEDIVRAAGSERVLFGTDLPWFSTMHGAGTVLGADITDEDRLNIFHRNGDRIIAENGIF
ncbi:MAG: amidohydrolase family protein [Clostridia bacterium]|nr:amidohydrolase family protein [Clostridia bacterium]